MLLSSQEQANSTRFSYYRAYHIFCYLFLLFLYFPFLHLISIFPFTLVYVLQQVLWCKCSSNLDNGDAFTCTILMHFYAIFKANPWSTSKIQKSRISLTYSTNLPSTHDKGFKNYIKKNGIKTAPVKATSYYN